MLDKKIKKVDMQLFLLYLLMLFPFFKPSYLGIMIPKMNAIYQMMQLFSGLVVIGFIVRKKKFSKIYLYICLYFSILFISTLSHSGNMGDCFTVFLQVMVLSMIVDFGMKQHLKVFLNSFEFLLSILVYINFLTIILYPNGLYINSMGFTTNWFLGYKNAHILYLMPAILISFSNSYYTFGRLTKRNYLLLFLALLSTILVGNSTGLVGIALIFSFLLFSPLYNKTKILNIFTYFLVYIISFLGVVIFRVQEWFSFLIVDILHKDITFTGRTLIWNKILQEIPLHLWDGRGMVTFQYSRSVFSAHNTILDIVYRTGIVGLISYGMIYYCSLKELWNHRNWKVVKFISVVILAYFIMMLTEAYSYEYIIYLLVICYNCKFLRRKGDD